MKQTTVTQNTKTQLGGARGQKIELTDAEKELLMGNELFAKMKGNDSGSSQGTPTNSNAGRIKRR